MSDAPAIMVTNRYGRMINIDFKHRVPRRTQRPNRRHNGAAGMEKRNRRRPGAKRLLLLLALPAAFLLFRTLFTAPVAPAVAALRQPFEGYESHQPPMVPYRDTYPQIVWLDAGHGGRDTGTYVTLDGARIYEKDIALDIVLRVYEMFRQSESGVKAFLTRADDSHVRLAHRTNLWNDTATMVAKADLVVSVHVDYYEGATAQSVSGIQVNYYGSQAQNTGRVDITGGQFAQILQNHLVNETGARDRNIRGDRGFTLLAESTMPAVIIETGFMSNSAELAKLLTEAYRMSIARGIYEGIVEAFGFPGVVGV